MEELAVEGRFFRSAPRGNKIEGSAFLYVNRTTGSTFEEIVTRMQEHEIRMGQREVAADGAERFRILPKQHIWTDIKKCLREGSLFVVFP